MSGKMIVNHHHSTTEPRSKNNLPSEPSQKLNENDNWHIQKIDYLWIMSQSTLQKKKKREMKKRHAISLWEEIGNYVERYHGSWKSAQKWTQYEVWDNDEWKSKNIQQSTIKSDKVSREIVVSTFCPLFILFEMHPFNEMKLQHSTTTYYYVYEYK